MLHLKTSQTMKINCTGSTLNKIVLLWKGSMTIVSVMLLALLHVLLS